MLRLPLTPAAIRVRNLSNYLERREGMMCCNRAYSICSDCKRQAHPVWIVRLRLIVEKIMHWPPNPALSTWKNCSVVKATLVRSWVLDRHLHGLAESCRKRWCPPCAHSWIWLVWKSAQWSPWRKAKKCAWEGMWRIAREQVASPCSCHCMKSLEISAKRNSCCLGRGTVERPTCQHVWTSIRTPVVGHESINSKTSLIYCGSLCVPTMVISSTYPAIKRTLGTWCNATKTGSMARQKKYTDVDLPISTPE